MKIGGKVILLLGLCTSVQAQYLAPQDSSLREIAGQTQYQLELNGLQVMASTSIENEIVSTIHLTPEKEFSLTNESYITQRLEHSGFVFTDFNDLETAFEKAKQIQYWSHNEGCTPYVVIDWAVQNENRLLTTKEKCKRSEYLNLMGTDIYVPFTYESEVRDDVGECHFLPRHYFVMFFSYCSKNID